MLYGLLPEYWGQGYAVEIATVMLNEVFAADQRATVVAFTLPNNRRSWRVMEKLGFTREADIVHAGLVHVFYRVKAGDLIIQPPEAHGRVDAQLAMDELLRRRGGPPVKGLSIRDLIDAGRR